MKKLLASLLLLVYLTVSTGFVVSVRYCMSKLDTVALGDCHSDECSKCGMQVAESDGCCKDEVTVVKLQLDQLFAKVAQPDFSLALLPQALSSLFALQPLAVADTHFPQAHGPPLPKNDIYLHNRVFRI